MKTFALESSLYSVKVIPMGKKKRVHEARVTERTVVALPFFLQRCSWAYRMPQSGNEWNEVVHTS